MLFLLYVEIITYVFNRKQLIAGAVLGEEGFLTTQQLDIKHGT